MVIKRILLFNLGYVFQNKGCFMGCHRYVSFYFLFQYTIYNCFALPLLQIRDKVKCKRKDCYTRRYRSVICFYEKLTV